MIEVVGHTATDHICRVSRLPDKNQSTLISGRTVFFGGGAANIAAGIATLGERVRLISAVGGDFEGSSYDSWMQELGIEKDFFLVQDANTPTAFIFTDDTGDQVTFFEWGASAVFASSDPPPVSFVHMATADPSFNVKVAEKSEFASFDPGQDIHRYSRDDLVSILDNIDILFANRHEVEAMCRVLDMNRQQLAQEVPIAVFTAGSEGSTLFSQGERWEVLPVPVEMQDPTGAGDSYRAGFLAAYARGYALHACCCIGSVTASYVVEHPGCQTHLPDWNAVELRFKNHFGPFPEPGERRVPE